MTSSKPRILVTESGGFSSAAAQLLSEASDLTLADLDRKSLLSAVKDTDVLWVRLRHRIDYEIMAAAPRLKLIVTPTTGLNHIDLKEAERLDIKVLSLCGATKFLQDVRATAEHTIGLMLALLRHITEAWVHVRADGWNRNLFKGNELYEKTVGIVGYGRLGRIVGRYLKAFDMRVLACDSNAQTRSVETGVTLVPLSRLLQESDLVTLHVNLNDQTRGFFGHRQFAAMKKSAWFINTSRGEIVDEEALLHALRSGRLAGAALDVLSDECSEGMGNHPLVVYARDHGNLIITPHIGGCTAESLEKTEIFLAKTLYRDWLVGERAS